MIHSKSTRRLVAVAAALLVGTGAALGQTTSAPTSEPVPEAAPPRRPLMAGLERIGAAKPLDDLNINIYGYLEGSYTYNLTAPSGGHNELRAFDIYKNKGELNQADLTIERTVDPSKKKFDIGFRTDLIWGSDASFIHSNGLFDWYDSPQDPQNQWDLNQAYLDFAIPVGNGLRLQAGKFVAIHGAETINPTTNAFYSHSYLFGLAVPFTHTGVYGSYALNDQWTIGSGITRGWEQSVDDNNGAVDYLGHVKWTSADKRWSATTCLVVRPERADDNSHYRTVIDEVLSFTPNPDGPWTFALNGDYGWEANVPGIGDSQWYGMAGYVGYKISSRYTVNARLEWFRDDDGSRVGVPVNLYEATLGVSIRPFPNHAIGQNLLIRPELRYDHAEKDAFDGGNDQDQATAAVDVIFTF